MMSQVHLAVLSELMGNSWRRWTFREIQNINLKVGIRPQRAYIAILQKKNILLVFFIFALSMAFEYSFNKFLLSSYVPVHREYTGPDVKKNHFLLY